MTRGNNIRHLTTAATDDFTEDSVGGPIYCLTLKITEKKIWMKKILDVKKFWMKKKKIGCKKIFGEKKFGVKKILGEKKF